VAFVVVHYFSEQTWRLAFKDVIFSWFSIIQQKSVQLLVSAVSTDKVPITCVCANSILFYCMSDAKSATCVIT